MNFKMRTFSKFVIVIVLFNSLLLTSNAQISCNDFKTSMMGYLLNVATTVSKFEVEFFLSTKIDDNPVEIGPRNNWAALQEFDPYRRICLIIHGYKSGGRKPWVLEMRNALLQTEKFNVILVDWSGGGHGWNYINAARSTLITSQQIFNLFQELEPKLKKLYGDLEDTTWNHLYFIGHSLGAHISGQTAYLLKQNEFWRVDRITGLDPAKPCFKKLSPQYRIDKNDAAFVDIIHTQSGSPGGMNLGIREDLGHVDFYVNGGAQQPECMQNGIDFSGGFNSLVCSHKLAYTYFTESLIYSNSENCRFSSFPWDGTYENAKKMLEFEIVNKFCPDCPDLGMIAGWPYNDKKHGRFLVFTGKSSPHCRFLMKDAVKVKVALKLLAN